MSSTSIRCQMFWTSNKNVLEYKIHFMHADFRTKFRVLQISFIRNGPFLTQGILGRQSLCHKMIYSMKLSADSSYFLILQTV